MSQRGVLGPEQVPVLGGVQKRGAHESRCSFPPVGPPCLTIVLAGLNSGLDTRKASDLIQDIFNSIKTPTLTRFSK